MRGRTAERQLREWMERDGNWRFKALLAASLPESDFTAEEIGRALEAFADNPDAKRYHLSKRYGGRNPPEAGPDAPERTIRILNYNDDFKEPGIARSLAGDTLGISERELENGVDLDRYMGRMLTSDSATEKDVLWREQLLDTVVRGAEEAQVARDVATVLEVNTQQGDHPVRGDDIFAQEIARGASIPFDEQNWSNVAWNTTKYGLGSYVTEELIDQGIIDLIEWEVRNLGRAAENAVNREFMNELVDNGGGNGSGSSLEFNPDNTPAEVSITDLLRMRNVSVGANFGPPDTLVMHDEFELGLISNEDNNNLLFANRAGDFSGLGDGQFPQGLIGIENVAVVPDGPYNGSNTWGWAADSEVGAAMYPRDLMYLYIWRDVETKDFEDPIRDLTGANVRVQVDATWAQSGASALATF